MGFYGVNMRADDFGRLGELMRRGGVWRGRRLLDPYFMSEAVPPSRTNGCYGWLIWVNAGRPCIGPRITERPVTNSRDFPTSRPTCTASPACSASLSPCSRRRTSWWSAPARTAGLVFSGGESWEHGLYSRVLGSITDQKIKPPGPAPKVAPSDNPNADSGFQNALLEPDQYSKGAEQRPLPPAGPRGRARCARAWARRG